MRKIVKYLLFSLATPFMVSCVNETFSEPDINTNCNDISATITVKTVIDSAKTTVKSCNGLTKKGSDVIEAYVTSSDEGGNFYKNISFVSTDGKYGFTMPVNDYNLFTKYEPGRKVLINLKDRYFYYNTTIGSLEIGNLYKRSAPLSDIVGRLEIVEYQDIIKRSCDKVDENTLVNKLTIPQALNDSNLNKLIELDDVEFTDQSVNQTFYDKDNDTGGSATNNILGDKNGNTIIVRVSEFANFAGAKVPGYLGKVRGVLTKFCSGNNCSYQLMIRTLNDLNLTKPRIDLATPIVGNALTYPGTLNEPFTSYAVNTTNFPKYINDADLGPRYWAVKAFSGNNYIEMSSFAGSTTIPGVRAKSLFMVPIDFTAANTLTFKKQVRFFRGGTPLKIYYIKATDYTPGAVVDRTKLVDITSSFNINYPAVGESDPGFASVGTYNIPTALTGNGFFVFEYNGTTTQTATLQIDDIVIN